MISLRRTLLLAAFSVPTSDLSSWKLESYSRIPANQVTVSEKQLKISVQKSASPLFYVFKSKTAVTGFKVKGEFKGLPQFAQVSQQGQKGFDDFPLRLGFVVPGEKRLQGLKKAFAPDWIKRLYGQFPASQGLSHIAFFNVYQNPVLQGTSRTHPSTELITEDFVYHVTQSGPFEFKHTLKTPVEAVAIWLSIDGDDTQSTYEVILSEITILTP